jgi:hypothetical protein
MKSTHIDISSQIYYIGGGCGMEESRCGHRLQSSTIDVFQVTGNFAKDTFCTQKNICTGI